MDACDELKVLFAMMLLQEPMELAPVQRVFSTRNRTSVPGTTSVQSGQLGSNWRQQSDSPRVRYQLLQTDQIL